MSHSNQGVREKARCLFFVVVVVVTLPSFNLLFPCLMEFWPVR
jgi:hypothetical protein